MSHSLLERKRKRKSSVFYRLSSPVANLSVNNLGGFWDNHAPNWFDWYLLNSLLLLCNLADFPSSMQHAPPSVTDGHCLEVIYSASLRLMTCHLAASGQEAETLKVHFWMVGLDILKDYICSLRNLGIYIYIQLFKWNLQ